MQGGGAGRARFGVLGALSTGRSLCGEPGGARAPCLPAQRLRQALGWDLPEAALGEGTASFSPGLLGVTQWAEVALCTALGHTPECSRSSSRAHIPSHRSRPMALPSLTADVHVESHLELGRSIYHFLSRVEWDVKAHPWGQACRVAQSPHEPHSPPAAGSSLPSSPSIRCGSTSQPSQGEITQCFPRSTVSILVQAGDQGSVSRDGRALMPVVVLCRLLCASSFTHATHAIKITHLVLASRRAQELRHGKETRWLALEVQKEGRSLCCSPFLW